MPNLCLIPNLMRFNEIQLGILSFMQKVPHMVQFMLMFPFGAILRGYLFIFFLLLLGFLFCFGVCFFQKKLNKVQIGQLPTEFSVLNPSQTENASTGFQIQRYSIWKMEGEQHHPWITAITLNLAFQI